MPRFFFHVHDGRLIRDESGTELADQEAARTAAAQLAGRLLIDKPAEFWNAGEYAVEVEDDQGRLLFSLKFSAEDASKP